MNEGADDCRTWIGRSETQQDVALRAPALRLAATLDRADPIARLEARDATLGGPRSL